MSTFTRDEIDRAFEHYRAVAKEAGTANDWRAWADLFTADATYIEHHFGEMHGREAIFEWISTTMAEPINRDMIAFPVDWYVIDETRGWVLCAIWNQMADPGDGSVHREINWTKLHYAGDGKFSYEEDLYNPAEFAAMIKGWLAAKQRLAGS